MATRRRLQTNYLASPRPSDECCEPDAHSALRGHLSSSGVWGTDDRVNIEYTQRVPWRSICSLQLRYPGYPKTRWGTGVFISPRVIMTAGHCVFAPDLGWVESVLVTPGQNRASGGPFGNWTTQRVRSVGPWVNGDAKKSVADQLISPYDYGAVFLDEPVGNQVGFLDFAAISDQTLQGLVIYTAGYPIDRPIGTLWASAGQIETVQPSRLLYFMDATEGNSGGPVFDFDQQLDDRTIVGIHTAWTNQGNSAVRITPEVEAKYRAWIAEFS